MLITDISFNRISNCYEQMWIRVHNTPGTPGFLTFFSRALEKPLKIKFFIYSLKTPSINLFEGLKSMCLDHFLTANADCKLINKTKAV